MYEFDYESFEEMKKEWSPDQVTDRLRDFDILGEFDFVLRREKGFYYPFEGILSTWVEVDSKNLGKVEEVCEICEGIDSRDCPQCEGK